MESMVNKNILKKLSIGDWQDGWAKFQSWNLKGRVTKTFYIYSAVFVWVLHAVTWMIFQQIMFSRRPLLLTPGLFCNPPVTLTSQPARTFWLQVTVTHNATQGNDRCLPVWNVSSAECGAHGKWVLQDCFGQVKRIPSRRVISLGLTSKYKWNSQGRETEQRRKESWEFFCGIKSASSRCWTHKAAEFFAPNIHTLKLSIWFFFCLWINFPQIFNNLFPPLSVSVRKLTIKNLSWEKFYNFRFNSNSKGHIQMPKYEVQHSECTSGKPRKSKRL